WLSNVQDVNFRTRGVEQWRYMFTCRYSTREAASTAHYIRKQLSAVVNRSFCPLRETPRPERRDVENNHDERDKINSHRNANPDVHCTNANQPNLSRFAVPDKKWICDFQEANKYS